MSSQFETSIKTAGEVLAGVCVSKVKLAEGVYWVGAIDWNLRHCGAYGAPRGTTYNSYLVIGDNVALIDGVKSGFEDEMLERVREIIDPAKIDFLVSNHVEPDHAGGLPKIMGVLKNAKLVVSKSGKEPLNRNYHNDWGAMTVKTGDELSLGKKTLRFIEAPMLHWPETMFTYLKEDGILFSNDAFGQHIASSGRFDDEVGPEAMDEALRLLAVVVSPYLMIAKNKVKEIETSGLKINMIAPAHGIIWRLPSKIIDAYRRWTSGEGKKKITVVYDSMWGSTDAMAREITRGISDEGVEVKLFNMRVSDLSEIMKEIIDSRLILVGSPTLNRDIFPTIGYFLTFLRGAKLPNKKGAVFGSFGWGGGANRRLKEELKLAGVDVLEEELSLKYSPTSEELKRCCEFGKTIARKISG